MADEKIYAHMPFTIRLDTEETMSGGSLPEVRYKKPNGTVGSIIASISGTELVAAVPETINDEAGTWTFQGAYKFLGDNASSLSRSVTLVVYNAWK